MDQWTCPFNECHLDQSHVMSGLLKSISIWSGLLLYFNIYIYMHRSIPFDKLKVGALILCDVAPACLKVTNSSDKWPWQTSHSQELCPLANCL